MSTAPVRRWAAALGSAPPALTVFEAVVLAAIAVVAATGWAALGLAHLDRFGAAALVASLLAFTGLAIAVAWRWRPPVPQWHASDLVFVLIAALAAALFLPGAPYVAADKDPGIYVIHGFAIAEAGTNDIPDAVLAAVPDYQPPDGLLDRFPALWLDERDGVSTVPQFYHHYPSLLAAARSLGGAGAVFQVNPLLGVLAVAGLALTVRRAIGLVAGTICGLLLATNMIEVFFAKYPTTEIASQFLLAGALMFLATAVRTRWLPAAVTAGSLTGLLFLNHPAGLLMVVVATAALSLAAALDGDRRLLTAIAVGLALPLPHVWYQSYRLNRRYSVANDVPSVGTVVGVLAALAVTGLALRRWGPGIWKQLRARWPDATSRSNLGSVAAWTVSVGWTALLLFFALREGLLGQDSAPRADGTTFATLDEINLERLGFFFTRPGLLLMWFGGIVAAFTLRSAMAWIVLVPGAVWLPIYLWEARIAPRLMWWARRYLPTIVPFVVILIAIGLAWLIIRRGRYRIAGRLAGIALTVALTGAFLAQSGPVRSHREWAGSWGFLERIDDLAGDEQAVFLWQAPSGALFDPGLLFGAPLWFVHDQVSALLPTSPAQADIDGFAAAFPGQEVVVLTWQDQLPPGIDGSRFEARGRIDATMTIWEEQFDDRPDDALGLTQSVWAWQLG